MTVKKFRFFCNSFKEHEILKETEHQIFYKDARGREKRESKISMYSQWYDNFEEMKKDVLERKKRDIKQHQKEIEQIESQIEAIENWEHPKN